MSYEGENKKTGSVFMEERTTINTEKGFGGVNFIGIGRPAQKEPVIFSLYSYAILSLTSSSA